MIPGGWDPATYRERAEKWRREADAKPPGRDRDACIELAEGYENLALLIDRIGRATGDHDGAFPAPE